MENYDISITRRRTMIDKNEFQYFGSKQERVYRVLLSDKIKNHQDIESHN